jgi:hypothetical protein
VMVPCSCTTALVREVEDIPADVNGDYRTRERT